MPVCTQMTAHDPVTALLRFANAASSDCANGRAESWKSAGSKWRSGYVWRSKELTPLASGKREEMLEPLRLAFPQPRMIEPPEFVVRRG